MNNDDFAYEKKLIEEGKQFTEDEIKLIADLLWQFATISVDSFYNYQNKENNEKCSYNGSGE